MTALPDLPKLPVLASTEQEEAPAEDDDEDGEAEPAGPLLRDAWEQHFLERLPDAAPFGLVVNEGEPRTHSVLGAVVAEDGLVITKASDLGPHLSFRIGGEIYPATLLAEDPLTDLALVLVDAPPLPVVKWAAGEALPGTFVYAPQLGSDSGQAVRVGTLGYLRWDAPTIHASARVTGLGLVPEQMAKGLVVASIAPTSRATAAGLRVGDRVKAVGGAPVASRDDLTRATSRLSVGERVHVAIERDGSPRAIELEAVACWPLPLPTGALSPQGLAVVPSVWRGPFPSALVHDLSLSSWDCGGPLYGSDGRVLGINIAAVASGRSLAIPASSVVESIERMLTQATSR